MLDILSSLGRSPWSVPTLMTLMRTTLDKTASNTSPETWQFLQLLVRKLGNEIPLGILRSIFAATRQVARVAPATVVGVGGTAPSTPMPHLLRPAVADGFAQLRKTKASLATLEATDPSLPNTLPLQNPALWL